MIRTAAISALIALTMSTGPAFAQGNSNHDRNGRDNDRRQNDNRGDNRNDRRADRDNNPHDNRDFGRSHNEERKKGRGVGPGHAYYRGDRLPYEYRHRNYVVSDWRGHHLSAPPRGHQWVQSGNDYILVAIATGLIIQLNLN